MTESKTWHELNILQQQTVYALWGKQAADKYIYCCGANGVVLERRRR